ncbi:EAL domain-containing protein [Escherichia coli]
MEIFLWQQRLISTLKLNDKVNGLIISVNVQRDVAELIYSRKLLTSINVPCCIRYEISENFYSSSRFPLDDHLIRYLADYCPLWLDDFGIGCINMMWGLSGKFSGIKISQQFLHFSLCNNARKSFFECLITHLNMLYEQVVIEGVSDFKIFNEFKGVDFPAFQGWLLPGFGVDNIPDRFNAL